MVGVFMSGGGDVVVEVEVVAGFSAALTELDSG